MLNTLIIGGGPIGMACGIEAQKAGLSNIIIEKGTLVNSLYNYPVNMTFFSSSEKLEIGNVPFISVNPRPNRKEALEYFRRVQQQYKLNIRLFEKVLSVNRESSSHFFRITTTKANYYAKNIIIATGFYDIPHLIKVKGETLQKVKHYYDDPHLYVSQKVAVIGASNSAIDAALEIYRKGAEVTLVVREEEVSHRVKYWVRPDIMNRIKEGSIQAYFNTTVAEITENQIYLNTPEGEKIIDNDWVLAMTGYEPDFQLLKSIGIQLKEDDLKTPEYNIETQESNVKGVYLAGVICGGLRTHTWFIENSRVHAKQIINHIKAIRG